jgi:carbon-monoxide dehydrogenase iron sulfur subunit
MEKRMADVDLPFTDLRFRKRKTVSAESKVCSGCRTCEVICTLTHDGLIDLERSRIYIKSDPIKGRFSPVVCHQCPDAPCLHACPDFAIEIERDLGTVLINKTKCTGCQACMEACPFGVIRFDENEGKAFKCDFCHGDPECVKWCPVNALGVTEFGGDIPK